jgi:hypothetical protein
MSNDESSKLNNIIFNNINITSQENNIIKSFIHFYETNENSNIFIYLISNNSPISIRLIDHFVTKYSKNFKTNYKLKENNIEQTFNVYTSYKQQLKGYQKKYFDPFSRGERIPFFINDICIITTISQLNFFKWFINKKIYDYVLENRNNIDNDMNQKTKIPNKITKINNNKPKIMNHSIQPIQNHNYTNLYTKQKIDNIIVSFSF